MVERGTMNRTQNLIDTVRAQPDRSALARLMLRWERQTRLLDEIETAIKDTVLQLEETITTGNVRATYRAGRTRYDYETPARNAAPQEMIDAHTTTVVKVDWRTIALDGLQIDKEDIPATKSDPSVSIKLL